MIASDLTVNVFLFLVFIQVWSLWAVLLFWILG